MAVLEAVRNPKAGGGRKSADRQTVRIVVTNRGYGDLCRESVRRLTPRSRSRLDLLTFQSWEKVKIPRTTRQTIPTIFISRLADIAEETAKIARKAERAKYLLFSEGMPIEALASRLPRLDIRDPHRIHVARQRDPESISDIMYRLASVMAQPREASLILDAWTENQELVLLSPSFERLSVPLKKLARFIGKAKKNVTKFEIDEDGRFLFWPHVDVHLGWEQMTQIVNPAAALVAKQKSDQFNWNYGAAIRSLREERRLTQASIDGLTERHLRRIEQGKQAVTSSALRALAEAHVMPIEDYLKEIGRRI